MKKIISCNVKSVLSRSLPIDIPFFNKYESIKKTSFSESEVAFSPRSAYKFERPKIFEFFGNKEENKGQHKNTSKFKTELDTQGDLVFSLDF